MEIIIGGFILIMMFVLWCFLKAASRADNRVYKMDK